MTSKLIKNLQQTKKNPPQNQIACRKLKHYNNTNIKMKSLLRNTVIMLDKKSPLLHLY